MPEFKSDNFTKSFQSQQKPMREFVVGEPEDMQNGLETHNNQTQQPVMRPISPSELEAARRAHMEQKSTPERIGEQAKKRIEILAGIGRLTKEVSIGGTMFSLRTLKAKETKEAALATFSSVGTQLEASYEARLQQLARSIFKIDGNDVDAVLGTSDVADRITKLENLEEVVINKLWDDFVALKNDADKQYAINTDTQAKEVGEDLKKL